jgi:hypothetical protein
MKGGKNTFLFAGCNASLFVDFGSSNHSIFSSICVNNVDARVEKIHFFFQNVKISHQNQEITLFFHARILGLLEI